MKKITKIIAFAAMILLTLCLTACGGPNGGETPVQSDPEMYRAEVDSGITGGTVRINGDSCIGISVPAGTTLQITVTPYENWVLESLTVSNRWGRSVEVTESDVSNVFTFIMPHDDVTINAEFSFHYPYPAPYTVTLGAENSGYTVYKAVGDFDFDWQTRSDSRMAMSRTANDLLPTENEAAEHYFSEYENTVNDAVADFEDALVNYNQATQDYLQPWLDNIKAQNGKYDRQHIGQTLEVIYNGSSFLFTDLIKEIPRNIEGSSNGGQRGLPVRNVLCYSLEAVFNEQYDKGFGFNYSRMSARYDNKKQTAINILTWRLGVSQEDLINDINGYNCALVTQILDQRLTTALGYLNQDKGTDFDLNLTKKIINLVGSTQAVTALHDVLQGSNGYVKGYSLDNNMEDAVTYDSEQ